jgi:hypothetical protein
MAGKLKALDVERESTPGKYADGDGLYLIVASETSKNWSYRYWFKGKERWHGLGSFKDVSLKNARFARDAARLRVRAGVDPVQQKREAREEKKAAQAIEKAKTFEECAQAYIDEHWDGWSEKHRAQWPSSLKRYAYPTIGRLTVPEIRPSHIYELLRPIWIEKQETANRVRGRIETIIAKNVDVDDKDFRNPAELTKQLREKLPKRPKRVVQHQPIAPMETCWWVEPPLAMALQDVYPRRPCPSYFARTTRRGGRREASLFPIQLQERSQTMDSGHQVASD